MTTTVQEVDESLLASEDVDQALENGELVLLRGRRNNVLVGPSALVKVNTSIGCNRPTDLATEQAKVEAIHASGYGPDLMMDLSTIRLKAPLYQKLANEVGLPVGTLPHYLCYKPRKGIDAKQLLEEIERQASAGVAWMTLHLSVTAQIYDIARQTRGTPTTARGGGIVIRDMLLRGASESIIASIFPEILGILKMYRVALSLGTTFRPANTVDALDQAHVLELKQQAVFRKEAQRSGVPVMLEGVGHMKLGQVGRFVQIVREEAGFRGPLMTLGPIPTDAAVGEDHISNAIGGSVLALAGGTDVLNSITREEHTGNVPDLESILEGLRAAQIAAHAVNISKFPDLDAPHDASIIEKRDRNYTCVVDGGLFSKSMRTRFAMGCTRCGNECPLIINYVIDRETDQVQSNE